MRRQQLARKSLPRRPRPAAAPLQQRPNPPASTDDADDLLDRIDAVLAAA